jgi:SAM-dependent methyltransferase
MATFGASYFRTAYRDYTAQNPPRKLEFYRRLLEKHVSGGRILDLGCAFGNFLWRLGPQWRCYGVDLSREALRIAPCTTVVASAEKQPFEAVWDAVTAFDCLEHVPDLNAVEREFSRLKSGTVLVMVVPVYDGPLGWLVRLLDKDTTHVHKHSRQWWLDWVGRQFAVQEWQGIFRYLLFGYYLHWPTGWFRFMAPAIAIVARKGV